MKKLIWMVALGLLATAVPTRAQMKGGTLFGRAADEQGATLPGVIVSVTGTDASRTAVTTQDGEFHFLDLPPGRYQVSASLQGFTTVIQEDIVVTVGGSVSLPMAMRVAAIQETITVRGAAPIIDTHATGTGTNVTIDELSKIPTSRDPWALLRTVPGVLVDRVNIAGNETGQQSNFQSKGTRPQDAVWTMDGVIITDMVSVGTSLTYFNYDNFEEIQVATSGQDMRQPTGGVGINMIVKRGTNQYKGSLRSYFTNDSLESSNVPEELVTLGVTSAKADHSQQISDYGFELGGPLVKDKVWAYGSWSTQDVRLFYRRTNGLDTTKIKASNIKGNWQASSRDMINVLWYNGAKEKAGRSPAVAGIAFDAPTAVWNQGNAYVDGKPRGLLKFEDNRVMSQRLYVSGQYAYYNTGFGLVPVGGLDVSAGESQVLSRSFGSTRQSLNRRPQHTANVDASLFTNAASMVHEVRFGGGWRRSDGYTGTIWPGNMIKALENSPTDLRARVYREGAGTNRAELFSLYAGDRVGRDRLTLDLGVRYDRQWGSALPSDTKANVAFPNLVPGVHFAGYRAPFTWNTFSPRAGLTYMLDQARKTIARATYARYAGQLETGLIGWGNLSFVPGYADYRWVDTNGDHLAQASEVLTSQFLSQGGGFNPNNPTSVISADTIDPNFKAPATTSVVIGIDRELMPSLAVQVNYSYTRTSNFNGTTSLYYTPWKGLTLADYSAGTTLTGTLPDGSTYSIPTMVPDAAKVTANGFGTVLTNWPGYHSYYNGLEVQVVKRMSNRWMGRLGMAFNGAKETYGDTTAVNEQGNPTRTDTTPLVNGGQFVVRTSGNGAGDGYVSANWQFAANGLYVLPYEIELGASVFGRQGYPFVIYRNQALGTDGSRRILLTPEIDTERYDNLWNTDLRIARTFRHNRMTLDAMADVFNVFNSNTELVRVRNAAATNFQALAQNLSPRILRLGMRIGF